MNKKRDYQSTQITVLLLLVPGYIYIKENLSHFFNESTPDACFLFQQYVFHSPSPSLCSETLFRGRIFLRVDGGLLPVRMSVGWASFVWL